MKLALLFLFVFIFHQLGIAQNLLDLKGQIVDNSTQQPIPYTSIYIDGTTNGTISNDKGEFVLRGFSNSSVVVISHVGYIPQTIEIKKNTLSEITILLEPQNLELSEIKVANKNLREKNLELFKSMFLGRDYWGENAELLNDSVLRFTTQYNSEKREIKPKNKKDLSQGKITKICEWAKDSSTVVVKELLHLEVKAQAPLEIDMPLLGYKLQVNLIDFNIAIDGEYLQVNFYGHYYFHPYKFKTRKEEKRINRNRRMAYFNSDKHFLRSVYERKLDENGYKIEKPESVSDINKTSAINFENNQKTVGIDQIQLTGLMGKEIKILFYSDLWHEPLNIRQRHRFIIGESYNVEKSKLYFLKDTCTISRNGTISQNEIMFGGSISRKRVGSYLPEDYEIEN